ncbi:MAG TPA: HlyD family secretion protein, partial [Kofleriaceae bacterium]|nr:HlyD family secretion protein [Kofleriaceae bacterium]
RIIRAPTDGKVSDISGEIGAPVQAGSQLMTIFVPGTKPEEWAYLPAADLPRLKLDMLLEVGIDGFKKKRSKLHIIDISNEAIGAGEIRRRVGQQLADTLKLPNDGQNYVLVRGRFESDEIKIASKTYQLHHGMSTKAEIAIETKPFLASVFPFFEKYFD